MGIAEVWSSLGRKKLPGPLGNWSSPKVVTIADSRLGVLNVVLSLSALIYTIVTIASSGSYKMAEVPDGLPTFWFESGNLYKAQSVKKPYCRNPDYNYNYQTPKSAYWNDLDIDCRAMHYGQILTKSGSEGFVMTYIKEEDTFSRPCSESESACQQSMKVGSNEMITRDSKIFDPNVDSTTCICAKMTNFFVHGAEDIELHIEHSFWATGGSDVEGSSTLTETKDDQTKQITTCLKKKGMELGDAEQCYKTFQPGQRMVLPISEWMALAGVALDERLTDTVTEDAVKGGFPHRRVVGTSLIIKMMYLGDVTDDIFTCEVEVVSQEGWTAIGSDVTYTRYTSHQDMDFYDRYRRGVRIQFAAFGQISSFSWYYLFNTIIQGLVLLGFIPWIVKAVAMFALEESALYRKSFSEKFSFKKALAHFGVQAALASQTFKMWNKKGDEEQPVIDESELKSVFKGNFSDEVSGDFVDIILAESGAAGATDEEKLKTRTVTCEDFVRIMSDGVVSLEELGKQHEVLQRSAVAYDMNQVVPGA